MLPDNPKRVMTFEYVPGKTLVLGSVEIRDVVGALAKAAEQAGRLGIDLTTSVSYSIKEEKKAVWSFFGVVGPGFDVEKAEGSLRASSAVLSCKLKLSQGGLISDTFQFPVKSGNDRVMILAPEAMTAMFSRMKKLFGSGGDVLLYEQGHAVGKTGAEGLIPTLSLQRMKDPDPDVLGIYAALGWGVMEMVERTPDLSRLVIVVKDNFETVGVKAPAPNCQFVRGVLAGWYSAVSGRTLSCKETECIAAGDPACRFTLS